jgi:RNA polymerase sigma factor (sigma-70 family)
VPDLRALTEAELERLHDDALIDYMRRARAAGHASAGDALAILVFGHWSNVERRVRMKLPAAEVEDLTGDIVADAIASAFAGTSVGEFRSWIATITRRAIADYYRRGSGRARTVALPGESDAAPEPAAPDERGSVEVSDAIERVMAALREDHRRVVDLVVFADRSAAEAAIEVPGMSEANVHQVVSRFRRALREQLDGDTGSP